MTRISRRVLLLAVSHILVDMHETTLVLQGLDSCWPTIRTGRDQSKNHPGRNSSYSLNRGATPVVSFYNCCSVCDSVEHQSLSQRVNGSRVPFTTENMGRFSMDQNWQRPVAYPSIQVDNHLPS
eukprot:CAMPEP_0204297152 /NCGR_PEP_ID=MMETSP0468-20130131/72682_1 /ASSEMBLY_ACC=CAM_ASM_000383 /TAXON_ID=2969 /ORGANISM="Oxyrrhis marina" /LENGTH=123 /DNA_ID=CAMNT_0051275921 /DNA_START=110 /DNA_END=482 /DNA_ORIENTATION=+